MTRTLTLLASLALLALASPLIAAEDKAGSVRVVYHLSEGNAQATNVPSGVAEVSRLQFKEGFA